MPKKVDHDDRRALIAEALLRVAARDGLDGVSLRHVAAEASVSSGMVQHYFRTKAEMMRFVLERLRANASERVGSLHEEIDADRPVAAVRKILQEMLPLDDERHREGHAVLALHAYASTNPSTAAAQRDGYSQLEAFLANQIRLGDAYRAWVDHGRPMHYPEQEAGSLLALAEGLNVTVLLGHHTREEAQRILDARLQEIFGQSALNAPRSPQECSENSVSDRS